MTEIRECGADASVSAAATDLVGPARKALEGFMTNLPELIPGPDGPHYRAYHNSQALPGPEISHCQWDYGDCTGRAVTAWIGLREMTGDWHTGVEVERGQRRFLLSLINPETGLVCVPDRSDKPAGSHYYHLWDQGRTLRALVDWHGDPAGDPAERVAIAERIERMIDGLAKLAVSGRDIAWGDYDVFTGDEYIDDQARPSAAFSPEDGNVWVWGGQLIEPLVEWFEMTGNERSLGFATRLAAGVLSGHQGDGWDGRTKRSLGFGGDGSFTAHFHNSMSVVLGIVKLGRTLYTNGENVAGTRLIAHARRVYDWIFDPSRNINAAGSYGWFPENMLDGARVRTKSETCCTADMIEFAAELAKLSRLDSNLSEYAAFWDDVERFTLNGLLRAQFTVGPEYESLLERIVAGKETCAGKSTWDRREALSLAHRLDGTWTDIFYPNDKVQVGRETGRLLFTVGGCCHYSGVRGIHGCWENIVSKEGRDVFIHMSMTRDSEWASIRSFLPERGRVDVIPCDGCNLHYRLPGWVDSVAVAVSLNGAPVTPAQDRSARGYLCFPGLEKGDVLSVVFPVELRVTKEKIGGDNLGAGVDGSCEPSEKIEYTISWEGNTVVSLEPQGRYLPLFP